MRPPDLGRLFARPIAHRGLHDAAAGIIENSRAAARAAIASRFAIECDVQRTKDGELVVFHDDALDRLTGRSGRVRDTDARDLASIALRGSSDTIPTFADFLGEVAGRTPLVVEIKSDFDGDRTGVRRAAELLANYSGPAVIESFDPDVIAFLRAHAPKLGVAHIALGIVGEADYSGPDWALLSSAQRAELTHFLHYPRTRPDFLSWNVADLPHAVPFLIRSALGAPVTTWTVRSREQAEVASAWTDQIVFEGFAPA